MPFLAWCGGAWDWFTKSPVAQAIVAVIAFIFAYEAVKARERRREKAKGEEPHTGHRAESRHR